VFKVCKHVWYTRKTYISKIKLRKPGRFAPAAANPASLLLLRARGSSCIAHVSQAKKLRRPAPAARALRWSEPPMAAVQLRPFHSLALPAARTSTNPNWLHLPAKPRAGSRSARLALLVCSASNPATPAAPSTSSSSGDKNGAAARWAAWIPRAAVGGVGPEQVLRLISGAAATPICQFVDSPRTFLHSVDPRVKLVNCPHSHFG
jgi:hypothetical protein